MRIDVNQIEKKTLVKLINFEGQNVLEIGCGSGRLTEYYYDEANFVCGIDNDRSLIISAQKNKNLEGCDFRYGDFLNEGFGQKFDIIIFAMSLHHLRELDKSLSKAYDLLDEGGSLLIIEPTVNNYLNAVMSVLDDERNEIKNAFISIKRFRKIFEEEEIRIIWEFENFEELIAYLQLENDLKEIKREDLIKITNLTQRFIKDDCKIRIFDIWKFILIRK